MSRPRSTCSAASSVRVTRVACLRQWRYAATAALPTATTAAEPSAIVTKSATARTMRSLVGKDHGRLLATTGHLDHTSGTAVNFTKPSIHASLLIGLN